MPGPPIRKPSDHSPPAGSPRNIAGHHVLHRPLMPRHPPNAQKNKQQRHTNKTRKILCRRNLTVRCSRPLYSSQPTHPHPPKTPRNGTLDGPGNQGALPQNPDSMPPPHTQGHPPRHTPHTSRKQKHDRRVSYTNHQTNQPPRTPVHDSRPPSISARAAPGRPRPMQRPRQQQTTRKPPHAQPILRKEVIQPHLPVRLPCYDFVPIASPTFNRSP